MLTVGVVAACQFQNHHERALCTLRAMGYLSGPLSISRFNRRFHALAHRLSAALDLLAAVFAPLASRTVGHRLSPPSAMVAGMAPAGHLGVRGGSPR